MKVTRRVSFPEARKTVGMTRNAPNVAASYSAIPAEAESLLSSSVITEMTWPVGAPKPNLIQRVGMEKKTAVDVATIGNILNTTHTTAREIGICYPPGGRG